MVVGFEERQPRAVPGLHGSISIANGVGIPFTSRTSRKYPIFSNAPTWS